MFKKSDVRVLQPINKSEDRADSNHSKPDSSKYDTDGEISESRTMQLLRGLKDEDFTQNYPAFRTLRSTKFVYSLMTPLTLK